MITYVNFAIKSFDTRISAFRFVGLESHSLSSIIVSIMSTNDLILGEAELDDEEEESYDEETGEVRRPNGTGKANGTSGQLDDSSEEEDDDDEIEARRVDSRIE